MTSSPVLEANRINDSEALLGRVLFYSVPSATCLDPKMVRDELKALGFTRRVPSDPSESQIFRRITSNVERKNLPVTGHPDQFENVRLVEINTKAENTLIRRVVVEKIDPEGRKVKSEDGLDFEQIADIVFKYDDTVSPNRGILTIQWINGFNATTHPQVDSVITDVQHSFGKWKGKFHDAIMRHWIKQTIIDMGATTIRSTGGLYFLEEKHATQLEALEKFITDHFPPGGECHSIEILDTKKQREMVHRSVEAETVGAVESMLAEIAKVKAEGKLSPRRLATMNAEIKRLRKKCADYSNLLERDLSAVAARVELLAGTTKGLTVLTLKGD